MVVVDEGGLAAGVAAPEAGAKAGGKDGKGAEDELLYVGQQPTGPLQTTPSVYWKHPKGPQQDSPPGHVASLMV